MLKTAFILWCGATVGLGACYVGIMYDTWWPVWAIVGLCAIGVVFEPDVEGMWEGWRSGGDVGGGDVG